MNQYQKLLLSIIEAGTYKKPARENMPGTTSLFGYQFRHGFRDGFPLLTTKKMFWKGVVVELLWFLRGDTNIKYLVDNGVNIWNEDAYNYYKKKCGEELLNPLPFEDFTKFIKNCRDHNDLRVNSVHNSYSNMFNDVNGVLPCIPKDYIIGDCGYQYGRVWRDFRGIDQIKSIINSIKNNPYGRRHLVTAIDPEHEDDLALYWCHALFQFNCRPLTQDQRLDLLNSSDMDRMVRTVKYADRPNFLDTIKIPKYYLDCQLYQRSADVFLGVPFNIASYALLTCIVAKICNMIPGEFIHTFGDVHIYDNHKEAVKEQLSRRPKKLPRLEFADNEPLVSIMDTNNINLWYPEMFNIVDYNPHPAIKAELTTGMKK